MLSEKELMDIARKLKVEMSKRRNAKGTLKDIVVVIKATISGDYLSVVDTKLYSVYGAEYCEYLELIEMYFN